ncbi:MAG: hypothetical protein ACQEXJ_05410 [Myxococcota bacterium]
MSHKERDWLKSEIHTLRELLDELPESEVIERIGFEHRLATARERLAALEETAPGTFGERRLQLKSTEEVVRVVEALEDEDISEDEIEETGTLLGVLPESRRFECRLADGRVISGTLDRAIADVGELKRDYEDREAVLTFREIRVRSHTRYALIAAQPADQR